MSTTLILDILLVCCLFNYGILLLWFLFFIFSHDFIYRFHSRWFRLSVEDFDKIHYQCMAIFKLLIFVFNLAPLIAISLLT